jgi:hypothetical protein
LNSKSLVAISGLPPEADMAVLKKTLLATANKVYWDFTLLSGILCLHKPKQIKFVSGMALPGQSAKLFTPILQSIGMKVTYAKMDCFNVMMKKLHNDEIK